MAKKKKKCKIPRSKRKRFQEKKHAKRAILASQEKLMQRTKENVSKGGGDIQIAPPATQKMSDIIIEYAEPLINVARDSEEQKKAIAMSILLWNLSLLPPKKQKEFRISTFGDAPASTSPGSSLSNDHEVFDYMLDRKKRLFPDVDRVVLDYECIDTENDIHLNVVYNLREDELQPA